MSHYSWHTLVKQVEKRRILLIQSGSTFLRVRLPNLLYCLRLLGLVKKLIKVTDNNYDPQFLSVVSTTIRPCVLMKAPRDIDCPSYFKGLVQLAKEKKCILLLYTRNVLDVSFKVTFYMKPCFIWHFSRLVNMYEMARHCHIVAMFWSKRGRLFVTEDPVLLDTVDNMYVTLDLNVTLSECKFEAVVVRMQRYFQLKTVSVVVIQRAVKQWLYHPQTCLGLKTVHRLNCCKN